MDKDSVNNDAHNDDVFQNFLEHGKLADRATREQVVKYIQNWQFVPPRQSLIDLEILKIINTYILDKKIVDLIREVPDIKPELQYKLIELLEQNADSLNQYVHNVSQHNELKFNLHKLKTIPRAIWEQSYTQDNFNKLKDNLSDCGEAKLMQSNEQCLDEITNQALLLKEKARLIQQRYQAHLNKFNQSPPSDQNSPTDQNSQSSSDPNTDPSADPSADPSTDPSIDPSSNTNTDASASTDQSSSSIMDSYGLDINPNFKNSPEIQAQLYQNYPDLFDLINNLDQNLVVDSNTSVQSIGQIYAQYLHQAQQQFTRQAQETRNGLITEWEVFINEGNIADYLLEEIHNINRGRREFLQELYKDIDEIAKNLETMDVFFDGDYSKLGRFWDLAKGKWQPNAGLNKLKEFAREIEKNPEIKDIAQMLGRFQECEEEYDLENATLLQKVNYFKINHAGKTELIGVTESDDLNHLLPTEVALLGSPVTEDMFYKKFVDKKLQVFEFISIEKHTKDQEVNDEKETTKQKKKEKGPFIIAVDTSGSMWGQPEYLAKIITFAVTKIAVQEKRKVFLISFSTYVEEYELTDLQHSLDDLIHFLSMSFNGGTDISGPVESAVRKMRTNSYKDGDFLLISDGVFPSLNYSILQQVEELKKEGNKFYALMIGNCYNAQASQFCNNMWEYNSGRPLKELVKIIKEDLFNKDQDN